LYNIILPAFIYSGLYFFSISFITVLADISPIKINNVHEEYRLDIGFPFTYYRQFWISGNDGPNFNWFPGNLIADIVLTWIMTVFIFAFVVKTKARGRRLD
jgi:hypothetical protein